MIVYRFVARELLGRASLIGGQNILHTEVSKSGLICQMDLFKLYRALQSRYSLYKLVKIFDSAQ